MISDAFIRSVVSKISRLQISCSELKWYVHSGFQRYAMIINTGSRTDIPAFFSDWFYNRIRERYALVRNPYNPVSVTKYRLDPSVVDVISFCTKNPIPMLNRIHELDAFRTPVTPAEGVSSGGTIRSLFSENIRLISTNGHSLRWLGN